MTEGPDAGKLALLDFGLVAEIPAQDRAAMVSATIHLVSLLLLSGGSTLGLPVVPLFTIEEVGVRWSTLSSVLHAASCGEQPCVCASCIQAAATQNKFHVFLCLPPCMTVMLVNAVGQPQLVCSG